jgi:hypothetical protein
MVVLYNPMLLYEVRHADQQNVQPIFLTGLHSAERWAPEAV